MILKFIKFVSIDNVLYKIWNLLFTPMYVMNVATNSMNKYFNGAVLL